MRLLGVILAALVLLASVFSARGGARRQRWCYQVDGRCEAECLSFEVKIGGCRSDFAPLCCKKKSKV